ncbi:Transposon Tf2-1 polyprotein, partial [Rhizoctonia solani AG-3 Rhs1AP]
MTNAVVLQVNDVRTETMKTALAVARIEHNTNEQATHHQYTKQKLRSIKHLSEDTLEAAQGALNISHHAYTTSNALEAELKALQEGIREIPRILSELVNAVTRLEENQEKQNAELEQLKTDVGIIIEMAQRQTESDSPPDEEEEDFFDKPPHSTPKKTKPQALEIPKEARLKKPAAYNGRRGTEAETFLLKMELYFHDYESAFDDKRKISAVLTNMGEGEPSKWAKPYLRKLLDQEDEGCLKSWKDFKAIFLLNFSDPLKKENATRELAKLRQTGPATIYASQFRSIKENLDWDETALIAQFRQGLKNEVQRELLKLSLSKDLDTMSLEEIIEWAIKTDDILHQARTLGEDRVSFNNKPTNTRTPRDDWLPKDLIRKRKEEKRCLKCGKHSHQIKDCPERKYLPDPVKVGKLKGAPATMSGSSKDSEQQVYFIKGINNEFCTYTLAQGIMDPIKTLIDSGSTQNFIDIKFARKHNLPLIELYAPRTIIAIDGKEIEDKVRHKVKMTLKIAERDFTITFYAMPLGDDTPLILGLSWLKEANPTIGWRDSSLTYQEEQGGAIKAKKGELEELPAEFQEYQDIFSEKLFKCLPEHRSYDCAIDFKEGEELPKPARVYPMSPAESKAMQEYMDQELADGKIRPSKSPMAAPCFFVKKSDGGLRLVVDYKKTNEITRGDRFPMPLQEDLLDKIKDAKIFSKLDLRSGYNNIRIREGDEWKTAFRTKGGLFEYLVMPFGLKNAPEVFQRYMNDIFHDLIDDSVIVYLDDILIYLRNKEEHTGHVKEVLRRIQEHNLFLKLSKCKFYTTEVTYIGIVITPEGISMEKEKIKDVEEWPAPKTVKQQYSEATYYANKKGPEVDLVNRTTTGL